MAKNLYETLTGAPKPRKRWTPLRIVRCFLLVYLLYFAVGALLPFTLHPGVSAAVQGRFDPAAFRGSDSTDRAALVLDNQDALGLRLQMIAGAEESIILTSFAGTAGAILVGVPIGLMTAIFLSKVAPPKFAAVVHAAVELLAGIPSVVYGLVGMILLVPAIRVAFDLPSGATLLAAIIVLAVMILPSIVSVSETALRAVPREYEEASLALGATHIETVFRVSVPAARSGIATAIVLGIGRAIGEAMAIIMVAGNVANMPGLLTPVRFLTTAIASEMSYASVGSLHRNALFSIGLVLFLFIMLINVFLNVFIKRKKED